MTVRDLLFFLLNEPDLNLDTRIEMVSRDYYRGDLATVGLLYSQYLNESSKVLVLYMEEL